MFLDLIVRVVVFFGVILKGSESLVCFMSLFLVVLFYLIIFMIRDILSGKGFVFRRF